jgi:hypothetical protein
VAQPAAGAKEREAASRRIITLGFAYPDAIDIRFALPRGSSHVPVRGMASQTSSARSRFVPEPGPANEPTASQSQSSSAEDE